MIAGMNKNVLREKLFTNGIYDPRKWRNKFLPEVAIILEKSNHTKLNEQVYELLYGDSKCLTCNGPVKLNSFTAGWKKFCSSSCAQKNQITRDKAKTTIKNRYGASNIWGVPSIRKKLSKNISKAKIAKKALECKNNFNDITITRSNNKWRWEHTCGHVWFTDIVRKKMHCPKCASSKPEEEIIAFIKSISNKEIKRRDRTILYPKEIDILCGNLGIEYNGAYWHRKSDNKAAQNKVINAHLKNIRLLTVIESDWLSNKNKVKARITNYLVPLKKIGARKLVIKQVNKEESKTFLNTYHFNGYCPAHEKYGLYFNNELLVLATFSPMRLSKNKSIWELVRLCTKDGIIVQGGASKLISHWKKHHPNTQLLSYHDLKFGWSDGLSKCGFKLQEITKPSWRWIKGGIILERWNTQKKKIRKIIPDADLSKTEVEIMTENGWIQEFNCGNMKWIMEA